MAAVSALSTCSGSLCRTRPHTAGTGPNPAQLKAQMAALVLALAEAAKANAAAQAQRNQQTILTVVPRIQQLAALAKAQ